MLDEIHVKDIALIEDASMAFSPQLTVLTGETGAGKTALLSALSLVRGQRGDAGVVRDGAAEALVEARLTGAEEHVLRRRVSAKGRSRCTIDGEMATVGELARAAENLRIHGQRDQGRLLEREVQAAYLDTYIDAAGGHLAAYREARDAYLRASRAYEDFESARDRAARELEFMRFTLTEIEKVKPIAGEYEQLEEELPRLQHAEQLAGAVQGAIQALQGDGAALDMLGRAARGLEREEGIDAALDDLCRRLGAAESELSDIARDLHSYEQTVTFEPQRLAEVLSRLDELSGLQRRFGPGMEQVLATWEQAASAVETAEAAPGRGDELAAARAAAAEALRASAEALAAARHEGAGRFCAQLSEAVAELAMKGASFEFSFEQLPFERWGANGSERIELMYRPSPASAPRPLSRIASGGELSRISLALECLHRASSQANAEETLVFDEIDQGVGGATGAAVARRLAQVARHVQVVVVTHLPQVAALADAHYVVEKHEGNGGVPATSVVPVTGEARVAEIARMLAGTVDDTALDHARSLLAGA